MEGLLSTGPTPSSFLLSRKKIKKTVKPDRKTKPRSARQVTGTDCPSWPKTVTLHFQLKEVQSFPMPSPSLANVHFKSTNPDSQIKMLKGRLADKVMLKY